MPVEKVDCATRSHLNVCGHELSSVIISRKLIFWLLYVFTLSVITQRMIVVDME